jgi:hypothetical protein
MQFMLLLARRTIPNSPLNAVLSKIQLCGNIRKAKTTAPCHVCPLQAMKQLQRQAPRFQSSTIDCPFYLVQNVVLGLRVRSTPTSTLDYDGRKKMIDKQDIVMNI